MNYLNKQHLLQRIAAIPAMERGKLSAYTFKDRSPRALPHQKLQTWENGKNRTRFVPEDEVPAVQAALEGYAQYQELTREYADLVIAETRQNIAGSKKNNPAPHSPRPRRGNPTSDRSIPIPSTRRKRGGSTRGSSAHGGIQDGQ